MNEERINTIKSRLEEFTPEYSDVNGTMQIVTSPEKVIGIVKVLKSELGFETCVDIFAIDRYTKENRYEVVINIYSVSLKGRIFVKVIISAKEPEMPSITEVWKSAEWYERETFDMHGIKFVGNKDLRRIYLPDEYEYYPLRKDYPLMGKEGAAKLPKKD